MDSIAVIVVSGSREIQELEAFLNLSTRIDYSMRQILIYVSLNY